MNNRRTSAGRFLARASLRAERGIALVMSLGVLFTLTVAGTATYVYTSTNARSSEVSKDSELAFSLAEAGIAEALSILNNALDPMTGSTLSPERTLVLEAGQAKYSGVLAGTTWTITSKGIVANPTGNGGELTRTLTRKAQVYGVNGGATVSAWSRFYHDNAAECLEIEDVTFPTSVSARGNICMKGTAKITGADSRVEAGGNVIMTATATNIVRSPGSGAGWTSSAYIGVSDNLRASATIAAAGQSPNLDATSFGFAIPADATITGIRVSLERGASASDYIGDVDAYLLKGGSTTGITDHAVSGDWGASDAIRTYGNSSDLWGTTWTPDDVNASSFGFRLKVDNDSSSSRTAYVDHVQITVYYTPPPQTSIGLVDEPVLGAYVAGTCTYGSQSPHAPCSSVDKVYAGTITQTPETLAKPTIDLAYWYSNAKPGPMKNCDAPGSFPGGFDDDTTYNKSRPGSPEITPEGTSYTCQVHDAGGALIGEISWNHLTRVLKIKGTIFIDGDMRFDDDGTIVHYQGRGIIYAADDIEYDEIVCAGGSGATNCITDGMQNWDPTQNLLIVLSGEDAEYDQGATQAQNEPSGLQGIIYAAGQCMIHQNFHASGPVICDTIYLPPDGFGWPTYYTWPPLGSLVDGQVYADPETAGDFLVRPLEQSG